MMRSTDNKPQDDIEPVETPEERAQKKAQMKALLAGLDEVAERYLAEQELLFSEGQ